MIFKRIYIHIVLLGFFALAIFVFFLKLFYPEPHLIVTPDFGRSDAWHFSFATKYLLSEALKNNELPLWNNLIARGFPLLGEGQTGIFFLPNLILYKLFPTIIAYNLSIIVTLFTFGSGIYVLFLRFRVSPLLALFGSISVAFSGMIIPQLPHITLLQGLSLLPWMLVLGFKYIEHPSKLKFIILSLIGSQQMFAGFPQATTLTWGIIFLYILYWTQSPKQIIYSFIRLCAVLSMTVILSAIQLLPSSEFFKHINASGGFDQYTATYFSFPFYQFVTLFDPYINGNPKDGSFPPFYEANGTIFWETSLFMGFLPLLGFFFFIIKPIHDKKLRISLWIMLIISILLMTGKYSPLYFVFSFPPLNVFRVPARFLWYFCITFIVMAMLGIEQFQKKFIKRERSIVLGILIGFQILHLFSFWSPYHLIQPYKQWITPPDVLQFLPENSTVASIYEEKIHNNYFISQGWEQDQHIYTYLRNTISPNENVYWQIPHIDAYAGRILARHDIIKSFMDTHIIETDKNKLKLQKTGKDLLELYGVTTIITHTTIIDQIPTATISGDIPIHVYSLPSSLPRVYVAKNLKKIETVEDAFNIITDASYTPRTITLVEHDLDVAQPKEHVDISIVRDTHIKMELKAHNPNNHNVLLVLQDTYYPGWEAWVNNNQSTIYPVNIRNRGVILPPGNSSIIFLYQPKNYIYGAIVSGISHIIAIGGVVFLVLKRARVVF